jgi:hypothetical protein
MKSPEVSPSYDEIYERTKRLAAAHPDIVELVDIGVSEKGGLNLPFVRITDPTVPLDEKQVVLITGGTHGSEETGRATAMHLAEWLSGPGRTHLSTQCFLVCTCLNPDGAKLNTYHNGNDVNIYASCRLKAPGALTAEARAILAVAEQYAPNCCVDVHGLAGGAIGDSQYVTPGLAGNISTQVGYFVAYEMNRAASAAGFPQRDPYVPANQSDPEAGIPWHKKQAFETNTLAFTIEITEHMYPIEESVRSGFARLKRLIEIGERVQWYQPYPGYPTDILANNAIAALMPHGANAGERRRSRIELMRAIHEDGIWGVKRAAGDLARGNDRNARITLTCRDALKSFPSRFTIQALLDRRSRVKEVRYNGRELSLSAVHGFEERVADEGRFIRANLAESPRPGDNVLDILYTLPVIPHDPLNIG